MKNLFADNINERYIDYFIVGTRSRVGVSGYAENLVKQQLLRNFNDYFKITVIIIAVATNSVNEM